jgi:hypothetical protein
MILPVTRILTLLVRVVFAFGADVMRRPKWLVLIVAVVGAVVVADHFLPTLGIAGVAGTLFGIGFWVVAFRYAGTRSARRAHDI